MLHTTTHICCAHAYRYVLSATYYIYVAAYNILHMCATYYIYVAAFNNTYMLRPRILLRASSHLYLFIDYKFTLSY
jgi:hypothetical protein